MTRLCLITAAAPLPADTTPVTAALVAAGVAAVVITPVGDAELTASQVMPLVSSIQKAGAAALLLADARLARVVKADGVHLPWSADVTAVYDEAREILGGGAIVGAEAGTSRHDAMLLGEKSADYVAFPLPGLSAEDADERHDLVAWWSDIFEIPVVAYGVATPREAADLAAAGADFVSARVDLASDGLPAALQAFAAALAREPVA